MIFTTDSDKIITKEIVLQEIVELTKEEQEELLAYCKGRKEKQNADNKRTNR